MWMGGASRHGLGWILWDHLSNIPSRIHLLDLLFEWPMSLRIQRSFYCAYLSELSKMTQKIRFSVKAVTKGFWEHLLNYVPKIAFLMSLPPLPSLLVQVKGSHMYFSFIFTYVFKGEILFHFCYPYYKFRAIKFLYVQIGCSMVGMVVISMEVNVMARFSFYVCINTRLLPVRLCYKLS